MISACNNAVDIAFLIDSSGSIQRENYRYQIEFVKGVVRELDLSHVSFVVSNLLNNKFVHTWIYCSFSMLYDNTHSF